MNTQDKKNHYRKIFKSNHLSSADLEDFIENGISLNFTIVEVKQEMNVEVAGKKMNANIAYFREGIKPLVLNATNCKMMAFICKSPFVENWQNVKVELYIDSNVKFAGQVVDGVRLRQSKESNKLSDSELILKISEVKTLEDLTKLYNENKPLSAAIIKVFTKQKEALNETK